MQLQCQKQCQKISGLYDENRTDLKFSDIVFDTVTEEKLFLFSHTCEK